VSMRVPSDETRSIFSVDLPSADVKRITLNENDFLSMLCFW
jgi:hypothetical protein